MKAFSAAEWVQVDKTVRNTALNAALESFEKKDYLTMPMSVLYLFNRPQDYGFARAELPSKFVPNSTIRCSKRTLLTKQLNDAGALAAGKLYRTFDALRVSFETHSNRLYTWPFHHEPVPWGNRRTDRRNL